MTLAKTRVAVTQITSGPSVQDNLAATKRVVLDAAEQGASLIVLPEAFAYLGPDDGFATMAEALPEGGAILAFCRSLAAETSTELVLGGFWERSQETEKVHNACIHMRADGTLAAVYRKIHLFDVDLPDGTHLCESDHVEPGREPVVSDTSFGRLGLSVCYDLRFPELYRKLVDQGALALAIPAAFTLTTGKDHWHVLLRARAIEQQCYVLAAAQTGHHFGTRHSYGHAMIVDPWGTILAQCGEGEGAVTADVDPKQVTRVRAALPSLQHRRIR